MKHQATLDFMVNLMSDPEWGDEEREIFKKLLLEEGGGEEAFDRDIEAGIENGYSVEQQQDAFLQLAIKTGKAKGDPE